MCKPDGKGIDNLFLHCVVAGELRISFLSPGPQLGNA